MHMKKHAQAREGTEKPRMTLPDYAGKPVLFSKQSREELCLRPIGFLALGLPKGVARSMGREWEAQGMETVGCLIERNTRIAKTFSQGTDGKCAPVVAASRVPSRQIPNLMKRISDMAIQPGFPVGIAEMLRSVKNAPGSKDGIVYVFELIQRTDADLLKIHGFGRKCLRQMKIALEKMGLSLGMKLDDKTIASIQSRFEK
jgi:hypothetical protein